HKLRGQDSTDVNRRRRVGVINMDTIVSPGNARQFDKAGATSNVQQLDRVSAAFALSASVAFIFNTLLAWVKDSVPALNDFMKALFGHHWTTHSIFDLAVFFGL